MAIHGNYGPYHNSFILIVFKLYYQNSTEYIIIS